MPLSSLDDVRGLYEDSAESYSAMMDREIELPIYDAVLGELATRIERVAGAILDSSCGSGHMLERIKTAYAPGRDLIGVDLSAKMVKIARGRIGDSATLVEGDMSKLSRLADACCAAVISFFAIHHVDSRQFLRCLAVWNRVLTSGGLLLIAAWEGEGAIDYGSSCDVVARRYREPEVVHAVTSAGFEVVKHAIETVEDMEMGAVHVWATKPK